MGLETATLALIAAGTAAAGTAFTAYSQYQTGQYNAKVAEAEAAAARQKAAYDEEAHRTNVRRLISQQRALYGKSGVSEAGSPLLVLEDTAAQGEMDALAIRYGGEVSAARSENAAKSSRMQGRNALISGGIGAGSSLLTGYSKYKDSQ